MLPIMTLKKLKTSKFIKIVQTMQDHKVSLHNSKPNNWLFYLFHGKTGLVAAVVSKAIAGWIRVSGPDPQSRSGGQQLEGASPLPLFTPVGEPCRQPCPAGFTEDMYINEGALSKGDTDGYAAL